MADLQVRSPHGAPRVFEASLNVLGYREEGDWVALAMEMDLRGYGSTFAEALDDLADLVQTQIDFAHFKGQPELIWKPAEPVWWARFAEAQRAALEAVANPSRTPELYFVADGTGGHVFAETLDEHNANVRRWRKVEAERAAEAAKAAADAGTAEPAATQPQ